MTTMISLGSDWSACIDLFSIVATLAHGLYDGCVTLTWLGLLWGYMFVCFFFYLQF